LTFYREKEKLGVNLLKIFDLGKMDAPPSRSQISKIEVEAPLASTQLPSGWQNLPEPLLRKLLIELPWQAIPKYCGAFARIRNICHMGEGIWVDKAIYETGHRPFRAYKDPQFNYLASRARQIRRNFVDRGRFFKPGEEEELDSISRILIRALHKNYPDSFKYLHLIISPEEMLDLYPAGRREFSEKGYNPWRQLIINYGIPEDIVVFVEIFPRDEEDVEDNTNMMPAFIFFSHNDEWGASQVHSYEIEKDMYSASSLFPRILLNFMNDLGLSRDHLPELFSEELESEEAE
jgi:hypothetical protein